VVKAPMLLDVLQMWGQTGLSLCPRGKSLRAHILRISSKHRGFTHSKAQQEDYLKTSKAINPCPPRDDGSVNSLYLVSRRFHVQSSNPLMSG